MAWGWKRVPVSPGSSEMRAGKIGYPDQIGLWDAVRQGLDIPASRFTSGELRIKAPKADNKPPGAGADESKEAQRRIRQQKRQCWKNYE